MREHQLLMKGPLVRATLAGLKTQTRRPIKPQPDEDILDVRYDAIADLWLGNTHEDNDLGYTSSWAARCPLGKAGDRLWVRETWCLASAESETTPTDLRPMRGSRWCYYYATEPDVEHEEGGNRSPWRPSIHMPRWACRLVLPLVSVRVERVQDITEEDAKAEGVERISAGPGWECWMGYGPSSSCKTARDSYRSLWISIYGEESWDANPWVWVAEWEDIEVSR